MYYNRFPLLFGRRGPDVFTLTATTTATPQTVTIDRLRVNEATLLQWGDGSSDLLPANSDAAITHAYATPGVYRIRMAHPSRVTQLRLRNSALSGLDTSQLRRAVLTDFIVEFLGTTTPNRISSAHMTEWRPVAWWQLNDMPAGSYTINSAHMTGWTTLARFGLHTMPAGSYSINSLHTVPWGTMAIFRLRGMPAGTYAFDSSHMSSWTPSSVEMQGVAASGFTLDVSAADLATWVSTTTMRLDNNGLLQAQVNEILYGMYQAATARTATGGSINLGGTNEAPSGTFQAAAACPVSAATPGKEVAHELLSNGCGGINLGRVWTTVTITA